MRSRRVAELLLLSGIALGTPLLSQAASPQPDAVQRQERGPGAMPPPPRPMSGPMSGPMGGPGRLGAAPMFLARVHLSDEQDDKIYALVHAQEPAIRTAVKTAEKSRHELAEMVMSGNYSEAQAAALARRGADAWAEATLIRARIDSQVLQILTPEQRRQVTERPPQGGPGRGADVPAAR